MGEKRTTKAFFKSKIVRKEMKQCLYVSVYQKIISEGVKIFIQIQ